MKVQIYMGGFKIVEKSGIGRAILHQTACLKQAGIEVTNAWFEPAKVIHINTVFPDSLLAALFAKIQGKSVVYYGHSTVEDFRNSFKGANTLAPLFRCWIKFCYGLGDIILTPTIYSKKLLESYGLKKTIYPISNGIDTVFFKPDRSKREGFRKKYEIKGQKPVIISVGHYIARKGIMEFAELARSMPEAEFLWFGYTNLKLIPQEIKAVVENPPKNLRFPGYISAEEMRDAYCSADVFAFMTHEETEGIVVLEALACGIPVVVRDIPVYDNWLRDDVEVCKARSTLEFKEKVQSILRGEKSQLTANGLEIANKRSMQVIGLYLHEIYKKEKFI
ncbi:glycosyltransferase [Clostridiales bacterium COT073_COT-073]|nr:glycosyltransferase [Clostridiales bacterium COT073_COT-073]